MTHQTLLPPGWPRPSGYANGMAGEGRLVVTGGLIGWDTAGQIVSETFAGQLRQLLQNTVAVLCEAGAGPEHVVRMTWYIVDRAEYQRDLVEIGQVYREVMGRHFPAMAVVQVAGLMEAGAKVEIETTAVVPAA
jgi:enamine deaminase RidA (YjgF/YER057c/UK114 family)